MKKVNPEIIIIENPNAFLFVNWKDFKLRIENPFIALCKKERVEGMKRIAKFDLNDFFRLLNYSFFFKKCKIKQFISDKIIQDVRHWTTQIIIWEGRSINSDGKKRGKIPCILAMSPIKKEIYLIAKGLKKSPFAF
jgi:hypothetical protein